MEHPSPEDVFTNTLTSLDDLTHKAESLTHSDLNNEVDECDKRDAEGRFISVQLNKPFIDKFEALTGEFSLRLNALSAQARQQSRLDVDTMKQLIGALCKRHYIPVSVLEELLGRKSQSLRQNYLKPMISDGVLQMAFPHKPNSPLQGYTTVDQ